MALILVDRQQQLPRTITTKEKAGSFSLFLSPLVRNRDFTFFRFAARLSSEFPFINWIFTRTQIHLAQFFPPPHAKPLFDCPNRIASMFLITK